MAHPLSSIRQRAGMTQAELADLIGCSDEEVTSIECGEAKVSLELASRCCAVLGTDALELFGDGKNSPDSSVDLQVSREWARRVVAAIVSDGDLLTAPRPVALTGDIIAYFLVHPDRSWELELYERRFRSLSRESPGDLSKGPHDIGQ